MERRMRTEILVEGDPGVAAGLAAQVRCAHRVDLLSPATEALVMVRARESGRNGVFNLGEVLVTEAKAMVGGRIGLGLARGSRPALAEDLAVVDAAYAARLPETEAWDVVLERAREDLERGRAAAAARVEGTRVDFRSIDTLAQPSDTQAQP